MDTAYIRIKFTPLLKRNKNLNSKWCLEIVPEVSYIKNFDKLSWKGESNCIEYTIPIKYNIILRKHEPDENIVNNNIKTYHSCVDLLVSPDSNDSFASGDVSRILSDTFILNKLPKNICIKDYCTYGLADNHNDVTRSGTATYETVTTLDLKTLPIEETEDELIINGLRTSTLEQYCIDTVDMILCDKHTNTDSISAVYSYNINAKWPDKSKSELQSKRTVSLAPMCSMNNIVQPSKRIVSKAVTCNTYIPQADLELAEDANTFTDLSNERQLSKMFCKFNDISKSSMKSMLFTCTNRSSPEKRIAQCIKYMETELLPLHMFLDKLITKCSGLGVNKNCCNITNPTQDLVLYKSVSRCKNPSIKESCEKSISNRVVYSIVFNE